MAGIKRFEEIDSWKEARRLTRDIYRAARQGGFRHDFGLRDQVQRASTSIMANIAEGFDSGSKREFLKFLGYALRSASEVQSHLYVAMDQEYIGQESFDSLFELTVLVKKLISGFMRYLRSPSARTSHCKP